MADDYKKQTVAKLRTMLKERGIPIIGLKLKADFVKKLKDYDAESQQETEDTAEVAPAEAATVPEADVDVPEASVVEEHKSPTPPPNVPDPSDSRDFAPSSPRGDRSVSSRPLPTTEAPETEIEVPATQPLVSATRTPSQADTDIESSRKRKRRSLTPPIETQELEIKKLEILTDKVPLPEDKTLPSHPPWELDVKAGPSITPEKKRIRTEEPSEGLEASSSGNVSFQPPLPQSVLPHPTTDAVYVGGFKRPLKDDTLQKHIISVTGDSECIKRIHIDSIRSHAYILLTSQTSAEQVKNALHGKTWPAEPGRTPLWAEFICSEIAEIYIATEMMYPATKYEVTYGPGRGGVIRSSLTKLEDKRSRDEGLPHTRLTPPSRQVIKETQGSYKKTDVTTALEKPSTQNSFLRLGQLFSSSTAKPMLYWMPVDDKLVKDRVQEMKEATKRGWNRDWKDSDELRKFTYEDGDRIVDSGAYVFKPRQQERNYGNGGRADGPSRYGGRYRR